MYVLRSDAAQDQCRVDNHVSRFILVLLKVCGICIDVGKGRVLILGVTALVNGFQISENTFFSIKNVSIIQFPT